MEEKIKTCQRVLKWWNTKAFNNISRTLKEKKYLLKLAEEAAQRGCSFDRVADLKKEISVLLDQEENLWQQRSHVHWLASSDKNTSFFHKKASQRFRRNKIEGLRDNDGVLCTENEGISALLVSYYQQPFSTSNLNRIEAILDVIRHMVTKEMKSLLNSEFSKAEVEQALQQMAPLKAPGPLSFINIIGILLVMM